MLYTLSLCVCVQVASALADSLKRYGPARQAPLPIGGFS